MAVWTVCYAARRVGLPGGVVSTRLPLAVCCTRCRPFRRAPCCCIRGLSSSAVASSAGAELSKDQHARVNRLRDAVADFDHGIAASRDALRALGASLRSNGTPTLTLSYDDICGLREMKGRTVLAVRAPAGTTLEVPGAVASRCGGRRFNTPRLSFFARWGGCLFAACTRAAWH